MPKTIVTTIAPTFVFAVGLAALLWIGAGYVATSPLAFAVTLLIGGFYLLGASELRRDLRATASLRRATDALSDAPQDLGSWLAGLDPSLRNAVRLRIEGERVALPAPALAPYLIGLLVLLGMLGTLLGMMLTLRGTGLALETATDLQAMRDSLAAPVTGLAFAFGTSIAGVATSAMLGLLAALCRRERIAAVQRLDAQAAATLPAHSPAQQRAESLRLQQRQAEAMPALVTQLQAMVAAIEQRDASASERQAAHQDAFHARMETAYTQLAASIDSALQRSAADSARAAAEALQPAVQATMSGLARDTAALHDTVSAAVQRQLQSLASGFEDSSARVSTIWQDALQAQRQSNAALATDLRDSLAGAGDAFARRTEQLLEGVSSRVETGNADMAAAWAQALSRQEAANEGLASRHQSAMQAAAATFEQHATSLLAAVERSQGELQSALAEQDAQRLATWTDSLAAMSGDLRAHWDQAGQQTAERQQAICDALARTAQDIAEQARTHAGDTIAEISQLVQAATEAPKAAADVIAELRRKLSDSMARDTAMLEERTQLMATLETLLDAVNHASTEQRSAIDALVATSADLLERVGTRFSDHIEAETGKLESVATQVTVGAVEVASLGEAFGAAVEVFGTANATMVERLQAIEGALDRSLARSDEQLAYYVAQAREVIDLSLLTQKQVIEDLQQLQLARNADAAEAA